MRKVLVVFLYPAPFEFPWLMNFIVYWFMSIKYFTDLGRKLTWVELLPISVWIPCPYMSGRAGLLCTRRLRVRLKCRIYVELRKTFCKSFYGGTGRQGVIIRLLLLIRSTLLNVLEIWRGSWFRSYLATCLCLFVLDFIFV